MKRSFLIIFTTLITTAASNPTLGQNLAGIPRYTHPALGGTFHTNTPEASTLLLKQESSTPGFSKDPSGRACIKIDALSQPKSTGSTPLYAHTLILNNSCSRQIRLKVCYYKTDYCSMMTIDGYRREQRILGTFPVKNFMFEYRELVL